MEGSDGLAAHAVTNMYGSGEGNTVTHHYAGTINKTKKKKEKQDGKRSIKHDRNGK